MPKREYLSRIIDTELDILLPILPAVALEGAKSVGKTATAVRRAATVHALDHPGTLDLAGADPQRLIAGRRPVLIDEWQRMPESWDLVRRAVDADASPGQFLLAGSAAPRTPGTHSGAGRIVRLKMRPLSLIERSGSTPTVSLAELLRGTRKPVVGSTSQSLDDYAGEVCASGLPGLRGMHPRAVRAELDGYLDLIIDRDFAEMGLALRRPGTLRRWMTAYAAATATSASFDVLRDAATPGEGEKPAKTTIQIYRDILERLWILEPLPAWLPTHNHLRRLSAAPKHHLVDPGLAARLLGVDPGGLLDARSARPSIARDTTLIGQLFESLITQSVRVYAQAAEARVSHLRTHAGEHEVDLIVERGDHRILAIEVKLAATVGDRDVRHLRWLEERVGTDLLDAVVITTGTDAYRRPDGVAVIPAALLGP